MIDFLLLATSLFTASPHPYAPEPQAPKAQPQVDKSVISLREIWDDRVRLHERQASVLLKEFEATTALYKEAASGDMQADAPMLEAVTGVARAYHAACARADIARRFAAFVDDAPAIAEGQAWIAAEAQQVAAIDGKTRELQRGLVLLAGSGVGPSGVSDHWSAVLAAEGWRAGVAGELRLIGRALTIHYARDSAPAAAPRAEPAAAEEVALFDGI